MIENVKTYAELPSITLLTKLLEDYTYEAPQNVATIEDLNEASQLLSKITNTVSFLSGVASYIDIKKREYRRKKTEVGKKDERYESYDLIYNEFVAKNDMLERHLKVLDEVKKTTSRMITVKQEINKELMMTGDTV